MEDAPLASATEREMVKMKLKAGVITGDALGELFDHCHEADCALPAVNTARVVQAFRDLGSFGKFDF